MVFTPKFEEAAESLVIEKLMAVVHRDMKGALDYFYPSDNLPDFALKTDGDVDEFRCPLLQLGVETATSDETEDVDETAYLDQELTIGAGILIQDVNLKTVRAKSRKYVRAFKSVVRSASPSDLLPTTAQAKQHWISIKHRYLLHGTAKDSTDKVQPVEIEIKFKFGEI